MPSDVFFGRIAYRTKKIIKLTNRIIMEDVEAEINNSLVFEQKDVLPEQDFVPAPPTYNLVGIKVSSNLIFPNYKFRLFVKVDNLLNVKYRDYLNRQRYFADDLGTSLSLGINFKF